MNTNKIANREGDIYEVIVIDDMKFEILYGYNEEFERDSTEPIPIYPEFTKNPVYDKNGFPVVTQMQEPCKHFVIRSSNYSELWCGSCKYFPDEQKMIGICKCENRHKNFTKAEEVEEYEKLV